MSFVADGRVLIQEAFERGYTIPAFNVCSAEMVRACIEAAELERAPVILQTYPRDTEQIPPPVMVALVKACAERARVPVMLHMDHGPSFEVDVSCLASGYSSVMYDGADRPLAEVIETTKRVVEIAHIAGAAVEVAAESFNHGAVEFTKPEDALRLREEGGADMIAISVGSEHGQSGELKHDLMRRIANTVKAPLVLHGGSGITPKDYAYARQCGVVKANIGSALYRTLRHIWQHSNDAKNHREVYEQVRAELTPVARHYLQMMDASDKA